MARVEIEDRCLALILNLETCYAMRMSFHLLEYVEVCLVFSKLLIRRNICVEWRPNCVVNLFVVKFVSIRMPISLTGINYLLSLPSAYCLLKLD